MLELLELADSLLNPAQLLGRIFQSFGASTSGDAGRGPSGAGWLTVTQADPSLLVKDHDALKIVGAAYNAARKKGLTTMPGLDPNHPRVAENNLDGINVIPISVHNGRRRGARERILLAQQALKDTTEQVGRLDIKTRTFATEILFDENNPLRAIGVQCREGQNLYGARHHDLDAGQPQGAVQYMARKEVILCGGAFNTPQLLMLSGIGPPGGYGHRRAASAARRRPEPTRPL